MSSRTHSWWLGHEGDLWKGYMELLHEGKKNKENCFADFSSHISKSRPYKTYHTLISTLRYPLGKGESGGVLDLGLGDAGALVHSRRDLIA